MFKEWVYLDRPIIISRIMNTAVQLIALGLLVITGNVLKRVFIVKKIPDIILLIFIGIIIGPVAGLISPSDLGIIGPIFSLMTLVIILFEGGISLRVQEIVGSLRGATLLSVLTFLTTSIGVTQNSLQKNYSAYFGL